MASSIADMLTSQYL